MKLGPWIDDFANLFYPNEGLNNGQRAVVVIVTLLVMWVLMVIVAV